MGHDLPLSLKLTWPQSVTSSGMGCGIDMSPGAAQEEDPAPRANTNQYKVFREAVCQGHRFRDVVVRHRPWIGPKESGTLTGLGKQEPPRQSVPLPSVSGKPAPTEHQFAAGFLGVAGLA